MAQLTKEEFRELYGYNHIQSVHRLISDKKIDVGKNGKIDTNTKKNAAFCKARLERTKKQKPKPQKTKQSFPKTNDKYQKSADQLSLEIDFLNAKLEEKQQKSELTKIRIAKEKQELIKAEVVNRCIIDIFGEQNKRLTEFPNIYAGDIIKIVQTEPNPKELIVEFMTQKIISTLQLGLKTAKENTLKYFGELENDE